MAFLETQRYFLNPYVRCIRCSDDELLIKHGIRSSLSILLQDKARKRLLGEIEKHFKMPSSFEDVVKRNNMRDEDKEDFKSMISILSEKKILVKAEDDVTAVYFDTILNGNTKLSDQRIGVVGAGFLGSRIVTQALKLGVKKVTFCDGRRVRNEDLERRYFDIEQQGIIKKDDTYVDMLIRYLSTNGYENIAGIECSVEDGKVEDVFKESDFVVVNSECYSPKLFHTANKVALETGKKWASVYTDGSLAVIGPLYVPGETLCYNEFEIQIEATLEHRDEYILYKDYMEETGIGLSHLVIPPILDIVSNYAAFFTAKFLTSGYSCINGRAIFINFEDLSLDYQNVLKLPRCPACANLKHAYKHSFV